MNNIFTRACLSIKSWWSKPLYPSIEALSATPIAVETPKPTAIIGEEYLADYEGHYRAFQGRFLSYVRANPDAEAWGSMSFIEMSYFGSDWARTEYKRVPNPSARIQWWAIGEDGLPDRPFAKKGPIEVKSKAS